MGTDEQLLRDLRSVATLLDADGRPLYVAATSEAERSTSRRWWGLVGIAAAAALIAIGGALLLRQARSEPVATTPATTRTAPEPSLLTWPEGSAGGGEEALLRGVLVFDGASGCYLLADPADASATSGVVFPVGTSERAGGREVVLRSGTVLPVGAVIAGGGGWHAVPPGEVARTRPSECAGSLGRFAVFAAGGEIETQR